MKPAVVKIFFGAFIPLFAYPMAGFSQQLPSDKVIDTVRCISQKDQSYALYLPPQYSTGNTWPVILVFDPSARGRIAVVQFRDAGKKFGYIIACSNNARNGPMTGNIEAASAMLNDVQSRFRIDGKRIFLAGFSGGSRLAMSLASAGEGFAGVIGCGAGLPNDNSMMPGANTGFLYYGLTGLRDMNYLEMHELSSYFATRTRIVCFIRSFNGGHEWPDASLLSDAVMWMTMQQMIRKTIPENKDFIAAAKNRIVTVINSEITSGNLAEALNYMRFAARDFRDSPYAAEIMKMLSDAERSSSWSDDVRRWNRIASAEQDRRDKFVNYMSSLLYTSQFPDSAVRWGRNEAIALVAQRDKGNSRNSQMASRLLNFISIFCSGQGTSFYNNSMFRQAAGMFSICTISDSENPLNYYNLARSEAASGRIKESVDALNGAVSKGFSSRVSVESDPVFNKLKSSDRFKTLMQKLK